MNPSSRGKWELPVNVDVIVPLGNAIMFPFFHARYLSYLSFIKAEADHKTI